jgi:hypothetical protein
MNIVLFKLIATPFFIGAATLAGRRWGSVVNGLIVGLPLTTGPISFILANQYGLEFATKAASGNLAGQVSMCVFCLTYSLVAQKGNWMISAASAITSYLAMTVILNGFAWQLFPAFIVLLIAIILILRIIPQYAATQNRSAPPRWDLPARIIIATVFVISLTAFANILGAQLSGLISTFPIFGVIFATFTHIQQGVKTVSNLLRGIVFGSVSYAFFFIVIGICLKPFGIAMTYIIALGAAMIVSGIFYFATRKGNSQNIEASQ